MNQIFQEQIPLGSEDFHSHIQRRSHKDKETQLEAQRSSHNGTGNHLMRTISLGLINDSNNQNQHNNTKSNAAGSNTVPNGHTERPRASSLDITPSLLIAHKLENGFDFGDVYQTIASTIKKDCISRTPQRIAYETKIIDILSRYIEKFDSKLEAMPFGSATYGFGGRNTDFNILVNTGKIYKEIIELESTEVHFTNVINIHFRCINSTTNRGIAFI